MEIWKDIKDYEGLYQISDQGRVLGLKSKKILRPKISNSGYYEVSLSKNGATTTKIVHRLVALAFIPNPKELETVNHKDENKLNNHKENLEWMSSSENNAYGSRIHANFVKSQPNRKKCFQYDLKGNFIQEYPSQSEAAKQTGISLSGISGCMRGLYPSIKNFIFKGD